MHYELWEMSTGNAIGDFDTQEAALAVVRDTARVHGLESVKTFALVAVNARGRSTTLATADALAERAHDASPAQQTSLTA